MKSPPYSMEQQPPQGQEAQKITSSSSTTTTATITTSITELDDDSIAKVATYLSLKDLSNLSLTCSYLRRSALSDSVFLHLFKEHWPQLALPAGINAGRDAFLERHALVRGFRFVDPLVSEFYTDAKPVIDHVLFDHNNHIIFSQGSSIVKVMDFDDCLRRGGFVGVMSLNDHKARITCMRLFPLAETSFFRTEAQGKEESVLVTSSFDHSIRLWWKGSCLRCFRGHNGPVLTLSDKLLGDGNTKALASGGEDGAVRLWSLGSSGKRGQHALKATLYGHEKAVKLMSVAGHKPLCW